MKIHLSLAVYHGLRLEQAIDLALKEQERGSLSEPALGEISLEHVQIVPQLRSAMTVDKAHELREKYPNIQFRLHANVRLSDRWVLYDLSDFDEHKNLFKQVGEIQKALGATVYSAHSGQTSGVSLKQVFDNAKRASDLMQCTVAIEGLYPSIRLRNQILTSWRCYQDLLDSGLPFALDLSHLKIVQNRYGEKRTLLQELLSSENCVEIHVSENDGKADIHDMCVEKPFWFEDLVKYRNPKAVIFTEGNRKPLFR